MPKTSSAKKKLLNAAAELFYNYGVVATGIDTITDRAGVAKKSLYNNFSSKADLILQYLVIRHAEWLDFYQIRLQQANNPQQKVLSVFLAYIDHAEKSYECGFRGCGLLNAAAEFPVNSPERKLVKSHKEEVESLLIKHIEEYQHINSSQIMLLAKHLSFILEGAMVRAGLDGDSRYLYQAQQIAIEILTPYE